MTNDEYVQLKTELHAIKNKIESLKSDVCSLLDYIETQKPGGTSAEVALLLDDGE